MPRKSKTSNKTARSNNAKKILSLSEKIEVILYHTKTKCSMRKLAVHFKIGKTQAGAIIRNQDKFIKLWQSGHVDVGKHFKFAPDSIGLIIDRHVINWYEEQISDGKPVTGSILQNKALEIAKELGNLEFKGSSGWLDAFKKRHNITFSKSKFRSNVSENLSDWKDQLESVTSAYSPDDMYAADEIALFFEAIPDDTSNIKYEECLKGELPDKRMTLLLCASMTGHKEIPLIITSDLELINVEDSDTLPLCALEYDSKSWMTSEIMNKWLTKLDLEMISQNRNICLFLSNTPSHRYPKMKNIKILHFPDHMLGENQPMNHGIIQSFKTHYRLLMLKYLISQKDMEENDEYLTRTVHASKALMWIKSAWDVVSKSLIERSFKSAGFECLITETAQNDNEPSLNEVAELLYAYDSDIHAEDYVNIDANLATEAEDKERMEVVNGSSKDKVLEIVNIKEDLNTDEPVKGLDLKSYSEAMRNLKFLENFFVSRNDSTGVSLVNKLLSHTESLLEDDEGSS